MAKNRDSRNNRDNDDERLGRGSNSPGAEATIGGLDPLIPLSAQDDSAPEPEAEEEQGYADRSSGDHRYARDDADRRHSDREHGEREVTDADRLELFRMSMFQNSLPALTPIPGWHLCWLTTANPRDSIQGRMRLGYELLRSDEVPGWENNVLTAGPYVGCVGINEMVAAKLPMHLYEMYMTEAHHNQPLAEEGKLRATLDAIRERAQGERAPVVLEEGMAALGRNPRRPHFEGVHGPRRTPTG